MQNRNWLRMFRRLKNKDARTVAEEVGLSHFYYLNVEVGGREKAHKVSYKSISKIANTYGIKVDLFFAHTDENGKLTDYDSMIEVRALFATHGYKFAFKSEEVIRYMFTDELADIILDEYGVSNVRT